MQLNPDFPLWVDAKEFSNLKLRIAEGNAQEIGNSPSAISNYRELLPGFYDEWIFPVREEYRAQSLDALVHSVEHARAASEYTQAIALAQKILALDRAHEEAHQHLMFCYAALGNRSAALEQYDACRNALRQELGVEPSKETRALYASIREKEETGSRAARLTNLPKPLTSFVGRERQIAELAQHVTSSRLVTLTGAGGSGKTRLAIQVGEQLYEQYADGVWFVDFAPLTDAALVPQQVAKTLGVQEQPQRAVTETLIQFLANKSLLLILDNCEHLVSACAVLAETLVTQCASLHVLATSREPLGIGGEMVWRVPTLTVPPAQDFSQWLMQYEAVRLFVERARAVNPRFVLDEQNASAVARICQHLDGIPLAIELAAARTNVLRPEQIAARLDDRFGLLTSGSRTALPRQQTLRALIDWSYGLLLDDERALFRLLAVFTGGFTSEAAEYVCSEIGKDKRRSIDLVSRLVEKSLVFIRSQNETTRYFMLETIREFAREKLIAAGEEERARHVHFDYFCQLLKQIHETWKRDWGQVLLSERENFRAALAWAIQFSLAANPSNVSIVRALEFAYGGTLVFEDAVEYHTMIEWVNGLPALDEISTEAAIFKLLILSEWENFCGHISTSHELSRELLARARAWGDKQLLAKALRVCAFSEIFLENNSQALQYLEQARALFMELNAPRLAHHMTYFMAETYAVMGEYTTSTALWEEGLAWMRMNSDNNDVAWGLEGLGNLAHIRGDLEQARILYRMGIQLKFESRQTFGLLSSLSALAQLAAAKEEPARAARLWGAADRIREQWRHVPTPYHTQFYWSELPRAQEVLGKSAFEQEWARGRAWTLERAVEYALSDET